MRLFSGSSSSSPSAVSFRTGAMSGTPPPPKTVPKYLPAPLPKDDIKIVIRPRDGLNAANHSGTTLFNALREAAGLTLEETRRDHLSVNLVQNLLVLSSPNPERAEKYAHITSLTLEDAVFSARGYIACPENTVKGVIHGIRLTTLPQTSTLQWCSPATPPLCTLAGWARPTRCSSLFRAAGYPTTSITGVP